MLEPTWDYLRRLPFSVFGVCLGTLAQVFMWEHMAVSPAMTMFNIPHVMGDIFWVIGVIQFIVLSLVQILRVVKFLKTIRTEFHCSYQSNFFVIPVLCLLMIFLTVPTKWVEGGKLSPWVLLVLLPLAGIELYLYGEWMYGVNRSLRSANPAFQLTVVGNFMAASLASKVGQHQLADGWFVAGCVYITLVLACLHSAELRIPRDASVTDLEQEGRRRLAKLDADAHPVLPQAVGRVQHNPWSVKSEIWALPPGLQPTIFLCVAPPAVAALATAARYGGECGRFCQSLTFISILFLLTMIVHLHRFLRRTPFSLAAWAFTFPSAALASASIEVAEESGPAMRWIAFSLFVFGILLFTAAVATSVYQGLTRGLSAFLSAGSESTSDANYITPAFHPRSSIKPSPLEHTESIALSEILPNLDAPETQTNV